MRLMPQSLRERLDFKPGKVRRHPLRNGVIALALIGFGLVSAVTHDIPLIGSEPGYPIRAEFAAPNQLTSRTVVRVAGVDVGEVESVAAGHSPRRSSVVTMRITDEDVVVHRDARAQIRWRTVLGGNMYIDLQPGSASAPRLGSGIILASRTSSQVELDQILQTYDRGTAEAQRGALRGLREGFADPDGAGRAIETLGPALHVVGRGVTPLRGTESDDLRRAVAASARIVQGLGRDAAALQRLVGAANRTLAVTDARRRELGELIEFSPASLDSTLATMRRLRTTLDHLDPLVSRLRAGSRALAPAALAAAPTLDQLNALLREARPLLRDASPTFDALRGAGNAAVPLMRGLDPTLRRLDGELLPYLRRPDPETRLRNYEAIGPFLSALNMAGATFDEEGHTARFMVPAASNSVMTASQENLTSACHESVRAAERSGCAALTDMLVRVLLGASKR